MNVNMNRRAGLGSPAASVPAWCGWVPSSAVFFDACMPPLTTPSGEAVTVPKPPAPPPIDTDEDSPTYGQPIHDGKVVSTVCDAVALLGTMPKCNSFSKLKPDCSACEFDVTRPATMMAGAAVLVVLLGVFVKLSKGR